jgi:CBS domain-containing protein
MTTEVHMVHPQLSLREAAQLMADKDIGALPVGENDRLVGMITDRDIAVRAVAQGLDADTAVEQVMSQDVKYCFDDEDLDRAARNMAGLQVRRLLVLNRDKRLVGILSLSDMSQHAETGQLGIAVSGISVPGGDHCQTTH